jgi:hypothetical protein
MGVFSLSVYVDRLEFSRLRGGLFRLYPESVRYDIENVGQVRNCGFHFEVETTEVELHRYLWIEPKISVSTMCAALSQLGVEVQ